MRLTNKLWSASALAVVLAAGTFTAPVTASAADAKSVEEGKAIAFDRKKGNCLACHMIPGGVSPGNIGPPLIAMKARYPNRADLRAKIWDATASNPETIMLPFGKHKILTEAELDKVVDFILAH